MPAQVLQIEPRTNQLIENMIAETIRGEMANAAYSAPAPRVPEQEREAAEAEQRDRHAAPELLLEERRIGAIEGRAAALRHRRCLGARDERAVQVVQAPVEVRGIV